MPLADTYPLLEVFWTILMLFAFVIWLWLLWVVVGDLFSRPETSGWVKVGWIVFLIVLPYLGVFVYLIAQHNGIAERRIASAETAQGELDQASSPSPPSGTRPARSRAKQLLDEGAIDPAEFDGIKTRRTHLAGPSQVLPARRARFLALVRAI